MAIGPIAMAIGSGIGCISIGWSFRGVLKSRAARATDCRGARPGRSRSAAVVPASARYSTPGRFKLETDCGTSAMPMPAETRPTMVCIWIASWPMRGVSPASRKQPRMASCKAGRDAAREDDQRQVGHRLQRHRPCRAQRGGVLRRGQHQRFGQHLQVRQQVLHAVGQRRDQQADIDRVLLQRRRAAGRWSLRAARSAPADTRCGTGAGRAAARCSRRSTRRPATAGPTRRRRRAAPGRAAPALRAAAGARRGSSAAPAGVSVTLRLVRAKSGAPSSASSAWMLCDSGGCVMCRRCAARPKCSSSATATK